MIYIYIYDITTIWINSWSEKQHQFSSFIVIHCSWSICSWKTRCATWQPSAGVIRRGPKKLIRVTRTMEKYGKIWEHNGKIWKNMGRYGKIWKNMEKSNEQWWFLIIQEIWGLPWDCPTAETNPHPGDPPKPWDVLSKIDYFISETWGFKFKNPSKWSVTEYVHEYPSISMSYKGLQHVTTKFVLWTFSIQVLG